MIRVYMPYGVIEYHGAHYATVETNGTIRLWHTDRTYLPDGKVGPGGFVAIVPPGYLVDDGTGQLHKHGQMDIFE